MQMHLSIEEEGKRESWQQRRVSLAAAPK